MKKIFCLALALLGMLALNAGAQPEGGGHNHSASGEQARGERKTDYLWRKSDQAYEVGDYERAIGFHKQIVALDPHDVESFGVAAWLMWSLGQKDEALAHIERGVKANPNDWKMWATAGQQYDLQKPKMPELAVKAKTAYVRAVELLPKNSGRREAQMLRRSLAHAARKADDLELSVATWRKLVADFPDEDINKQNLARVEKLLEEKQAEKKKVALSPILIGGAGAATLAFIGGVLRSRKQRAADSSKPETPFAA